MPVEAPTPPQAHWDAKEAIETLAAKVADLEARLKRHIAFTRNAPTAAPVAPAPVLNQAGQDAALTLQKLFGLRREQAEAAVVLAASKLKSPTAQEIVLAAGKEL